MRIGGAEAPASAALASSLTVGHSSMFAFFWASCIAKAMHVGRPHFLQLVFGSSLKISRPESAMANPFLQKLPQLWLSKIRPVAPGHSRESGNPEAHGKRLDSGFRGNDNQSTTPECQISLDREITLPTKPYSLASEALIQ